MLFLKNFNNSCYMDVILMSLLFNDNDFIEKEIFLKTDSEIIDIQEELLFIKHGLQSNCLEFRNSLKKIDNYEDFTDNDQRDAGEFLKYLFRLFKVDCCVNKELTFIIEDNNSQFVGYTINDTASPIIDINNLEKGNSIIDLLISPDYFEVDNYVYKGQNFKHLRKNTIFVDYGMMIINLNRFHINGFINKKIIPNQNLILASNKKFELNSIIIWNNFHYSSFINIEGIWHYYDDMGIDFVKVGDFSELLKIDLVLTNGILFFYL